MCYVVTVEKKHMKMNYELNCFDLGIRVGTSQGWESVFAVPGQRWGTPWPKCQFITGLK